MVTAPPFTDRRTRERRMKTMPNASDSEFTRDPKTTGGPLLFAMLAFLVAFPWIAQLLPQQFREYIGILFR